MNSNTTTKSRTPALRFPEFANSGEWVEKKLGEICDSFSGGTPLTSNKDYYGGNIPFIRSAEINKEKTELFLTKLGFNNSSAKIVNKGDVLVALYGANSGDVAIAKIDGAINQAILCLQSKENNFFISQFLELQKDNIISTYLQGGQGNLSGEIIKSLIVPIPSLPEQRKIAECLSSLDDIITLSTQKLAALKKHKKGLMQRLFPDIKNNTLDPDSQEATLVGEGRREKGVGSRVPELRFPEFANSGEWVEDEIGNVIVTITPPLKLQTSNYLLMGNYPIIDQSQNYICGWTNDSDALIKEDFPLIVFGDHTCIVKIINKPFAQGADGIKIFKTKDYPDTCFLYQYICSNPVEQENYKRHFSNLKEKKVYYPKNISEQRKIAACLSSLDDVILAQGKKVEALKKHKKGLMQRLFPAVVRDSVVTFFPHN